MCLALVAASLVQLAAVRVARADRIDEWASDLASKDSDKKVRLAAAVCLSNVDDQRASKALIKALRGDSEESIRGVAADGLSRQVAVSTATSLRDEAMKALTRASKRDKSRFVRARAASALSAIQAPLGTPSPGIYVNIGAMTASAASASNMTGVMQQAVQNTFSQQAPSISTSWPGGNVPTARQLAASGTQGYHVGGSVLQISTQSEGSDTLVGCKLSMYIATLPKQSIIAFVDSGARLRASSSPASINAAITNCVRAAVRHLVASKIIPAIQPSSPGGGTGSASTSSAPASSSASGSPGLHHEVR